MIVLCAVAVAVAAADRNHCEASVLSFAFHLIHKICRFFIAQCAFQCEHCHFCGCCLVLLQVREQTIDSGCVFWHIASSFSRSIYLCPFRVQERKWESTIDNWPYTWKSLHYALYSYQNGLCHFGKENLKCTRFLNAFSPRIARMSWWLFITHFSFSRCQCSRKTVVKFVCALSNFHTESEPYAYTCRMHILIRSHSHTLSLNRVRVAMIHQSSPFKEETTNNSQPKW